MLSLSDMDQTELTAPPNSPLTGEARLAHARRRVAALKGFYIHLSVFALVLLGLLAVNSATGGPWCYATSRGTP